MANKVNLETVKRVKNGDDKSLGEVFKKYNGLIMHVRNKYRAKGYDQDDFESIAKVGIWNACLKFDEGRLKFIYNRKTKTWRVDETVFNKVFGKCIKTNILRLTARRWRADQKNKRAGEELSYESIVSTDEDDRVGTSQDLAVVTEASQVNTGYQSLLIDIDSRLKKMHRIVWILAFEGYQRKEIATMLNCGPSYIRKILKEIYEILDDEGLLSAT